MPFEMYRFDVICNKPSTCLRRLRQSGESRSTACRRVCVEAIDVRDNQFMIVARAP
jgi:hypothetical protein